MRPVSLAALLLAAVAAGAPHAALVAGAGTSTTERRAASAPRTVEGILVDTKCYALDPDEIGDDHTTAAGKPWVRCATVCARMGIPVGVAVNGKPGGELIVLITPVPPLADHMGAWARVTGTPVLDGRGLVARTLEVRGKNGRFTKVNLEGSTAAMEQH
jgi:hypothetical protein